MSREPEARVERSQRSVAAVRALVDDRGGRRWGHGGVTSAADFRVLPRAARGGQTGPGGWGFVGGR
ncbi:hypothetical protein V5P93_004840 [Actinokineospora auranticolor]|uniref:Uncharacterized protein n=1 Tax=Actinokineospora auranticolor TaxID=155976 RepID=A0A2S6GNI4_9PSEU|nr:hypothetical protein [Actinokineospora auranticolor]PPK66802.1 hypothetical protein CLV40_109187 [Actinokineospora auranticolor]